MVTASLEGVHLKLARARFHARDLKKRVDAALVLDGPFVRRELDGEPSKYVYRVETLPVIDPEWSAVLGDFLTNLRAALDHLYFQLPVLEGRKGSEQDNFPICLREPRDDKGDPKPLRTSRITNQDVIDALVAVQPYSRLAPLTNGLCILNELVNTDKHRLILVVVAALNPSVTWWAVDATPPAFEITFGPLGQDDPIAWFNFGGRKPYPNFDPHLVPQIRLEDKSLKRNAVLQTLSLEQLLHFLYTAVAGEVINQRFAAFFGETPPQIADVFAL
jgi:hypothetical protein